jgi:hypothetical protein
VTVKLASHLWHIAGDVAIGMLESGRLQAYTAINDAEVVVIPQAEPSSWFRARCPDHWFSDLVVDADRDEIVVTGVLGCPEGSDPVEHAATFRDLTRDQRVRIAEQAEARWGRKVSWAVRCGSTEVSFTTLSVPVMTRLRYGERRLLDTLVAAGVARSRSEALAWCVRLVATHEDDWICRLRQAIDEVDRVRSEGPGG